MHHAFHHFYAFVYVGLTALVHVDLASRKVVGSHHVLRVCLEHALVDIVGDIKVALEDVEEALVEHVQAPQVINGSGFFLFEWV